MPRLNARYGPPPSEFAERIRAERERLGITQEDAARRLGIGRGSYRQLEVTANPQASTLIALVQELGMKAHLLVPELFVAAKLRR